MPNENKEIENKPSQNTQPQQSQPAQIAAELPTPNEYIDNYLATLGTGLTRDKMPEMVKAYQETLSESERQKQQIGQYENTISGLQKEKAKAEKLAVDSTNKYVQYYTNHILSSELNKSNAVTEAVLDMKSFQDLFEFDVKENKVKSKTGEDLQKTIDGFLKDKPFLVKASNTGGSGSQAGNSEGVQVTEDMTPGQAIWASLMQKE